jgi:hypothetical protein
MLNKSLLANPWNWVIVILIILFWYYGMFSAIRGQMTVLAAMAKPPAPATPITPAT